MKTQAKSLDDILFSDNFAHNDYGNPNKCLDIIFINGCFIYKDQGTWTHEELSARVVLAKSLNVGGIM